MPDLVDPNQQKQAPNLPTQSPDDTGEGEASGSAPIPTSDDDVLDMVEKTVGEEPREGETIADVVNKAERDRRVGPDESPEKS